MEPSSNTSFNDLECILQQFGNRVLQATTKLILKNY